MNKFESTLNRLLAHQFEKLYSCDFLENFLSFPIYPYENLTSIMAVLGPHGVNFMRMISYYKLNTCGF